MTSPNTIIADMQAEIDALRLHNSELLANLKFVLSGIEGGHIKCAPYFDFDPEATQIEFKPLSEKIREAINCYKSPEISSLC